MVRFPGGVRPRPRPGLSKASMEKVNKELSLLPWAELLSPQAAIPTADPPASGFAPGGIQYPLPLMLLTGSIRLLYGRSPLSACGGSH